MDGWLACPGCALKLRAAGREACPRCGAALVAPPITPAPSPEGASAANPYLRPAASLDLPAARAPAKGRRPRRLATAMAFALVLGLALFIHDEPPGDADGWAADGVVTLVLLLVAAGLWRGNEIVRGLSVGLAVLCLIVSGVAAVRTNDEGLGPLTGVFAAFVASVWGEPSRRKTALAVTFFGASIGAGALSRAARPVRDRTVESVHGTAVPYVLTLPAGHWQPLGRDAINRIDPATEAWLMWPAKSAEIMTLPEKSPIPTDVDQLVRVLLRLDAAKPHFRLVSQEPVDVPGATARLLRDRFDDGAGVPVQKFDLVLVRGDHFLQIIGAAPASSDPSVFRELERIVKSVRFEKGPPAATVAPPSGPR
jgi:hypothetical protein